MLLHCFGEDEDVVHIDYHAPFCNKVCEYFVHHGWNVAEEFIIPKNMTVGWKLLLLV